MGRPEQHQHHRLHPDDAQHLGGELLPQLQRGISAGEAARGQAPAESGDGDAPATPTGPAARARAPAAAVAQRSLFYRALLGHRARQGLDTRLDPAATSNTLRIPLREKNR